MKDIPKDTPGGTPLQAHKSARSCLGTPLAARNPWRFVARLGCFVALARLPFESHCL